MLAVLHDVHPQQLLVLQLQLVVLAQEQLEHDVQLTAASSISFETSIS
ncbi:hypothetical protein [Arachnia propionica]|nr:hypothetical protein [Arachnia propionica]